MRNLIILALIVLSGACYSQFVVLNNPSFELFSSCPDSIGQAYKLDGWVVYQGNPSLFSRCATTAGDVIVGIPDNFAGSEPTSDGGASYIGMMSLDTAGNRDFMTGKFKFKPLVNHVYRFAMTISTADESIYAVMSPFQMKIQIDSVDFLDYDDDFDVNFATVTPYNNRVGWNLLTAFWTAPDSNYRYFGLGNFKRKDSLFRINGGSIFGAYYYIDEIVAKDVTPIGILEGMKSRLKVATLSNNTFRILNKKPQSELTITDIHGRVIMKTMEETISLFDYPPGIYIFRINSLFRKVTVF